MIERTCSTPTLLNIEDDQISFDEILPVTAGSKDNPVENTYQILSTVNNAVRITFAVREKNNIEISCLNDPNSRVTIYSARDTTFVNSAFYADVHHITFTCDTAASNQCHPGKSTCIDKYSVTLRPPKKSSVVSTVSPSVSYCNDTHAMDCDSREGRDLKTTALSIISNLNHAVKMSVSTTDVVIDEDFISTTAVNSQVMRKFLIDFLLKGAKIRQY